MILTFVKVIMNEMFSLIVCYRTRRGIDDGAFGSSLGRYGFGF